jgi:hypothetical protein
MRRLVLLLFLPIVLAASLAACSTVRLSYDNADWLLARMRRLAWSRGAGFYSRGT